MSDHGRIFRRIAYEQQLRAREWASGAVWRLRRTHRRELDGDPERVLIVLTGLLGDSVMCTPVLEEARRRWPRAHVTLLGLRHNLDLLRACPCVDEFHEADAVPFSLRGHRRVRALELWVRDQRFDVAIILLGDQFASLLARARVPIRVGRRGHPLTAAATHTYDIGDDRSWGPGERLGALRALGVQVREAAPSLWVDDDARERADRTLAAVGVSRDSGYVVIHPFGRTRAQWWPADRVDALATTWEGRGVRTLLVGGAETATIPVEGDAIVDVRGALDVSELVAVIADAQLVVSTDSGPFHIAGALGRPCLGLFRSTRPEHAGRYPSVRAIVGADGACVGRCRWDRCSFDPCRQLVGIDVASVAEAAAQAVVRWSGDGKPGDGHR